MMGGVCVCAGVVWVVWGDIKLVVSIKWSGWLLVLFGLGSSLGLMVCIRMISSCVSNSAWGIVPSRFHRVG